MSLFILLIAFLEWFTTLSIEIIAIRNFTPIIGTNSISTSIILWVILLALSYWYYIWGKKTKEQTKESLINKIIFNLAISSAYYLFFTFIFDIYIIESLLKFTWNYVISILLSSFFLFFIPVFLASQTIPLLSEILKWENTWEKIGKLLFFSTIGSFFGSVLTSTLLFSTIWVYKSWVLNSIILAFIAILLSIKWFKKINFSLVLSVIVMIISLILMSFNINNKSIIFSQANSYHNIVIYDYEDKRIFSQNSWFASGIDINTKESFFKYIIEIKNKLVEGEYKNIWMIWAAWFTLPYEMSMYDFIENIEITDVDKSLKHISEKYFLETELSPKINFVTESSRYFLNNRIKDNIKYDAIVVDVYVGNSLSPQTLTLEFFESLNKVSDDIYINMITDRKLESDFSKKLLNTMKKAFWELYYKDTNIWDFSFKTNFVMTNKEFLWYNKYDEENDLGIYTDDKNSIEIDLFKIID